MAATFSQPQVIPIPDSSNPALACRISGKYT
jgi:hypothetical protein